MEYYLIVMIKKAKHKNKAEQTILPWAYRHFEIL